MRLTKKLIAMGLSILLLLPAFSLAAASAEDETAVLSEQMQLLMALGIVYESDYEKPHDSVMTRAEFSMMLIKLYGMESLASAMYQAGYFQDVAADYEETGYINAAASLGLILPVKSGIFEPKSGITGEAAACALAKLLGYGSALEGDTEAYLTAVNALAHSRVSGFGSVAADAVLTRGQVFDIFEQMLNAPVLALDSIGSVNGEPSGRYTTDKNVTVLSEYHKVFKQRGVVYANERTSLESAKEALKNNKVQIGDVIYEDAWDLCADYLGHHVIYYYRAEASNAYDELICVLPGYTETVVLTPSDISSASQMRLTYFNEDGETETVNLNGAYILYNGAATASGVNFKPESGSVTLIDNDEDGVYEVVSILAYTELIYQSSSTAGDVFYGKYTQRIDCTAADSITIFDAVQGKAISSALLEKGAIILGYASADSDRAELYMTTESVSGTVEERRQEDGTVVVLDGVAYPLSQTLERHLAGSLIDELTPGLSYTLFFNHNGEVAYYEKNKDVFTDYEFAYLMAGKRKSGLDSAVIIKFYSQYGMEAEGELADTVYIDNEKVKEPGKAYALLCKNGEYGTQGSAVVPQVIRLKTNTEGRITHIDMAAAAANGQDSLYVIHDAAVHGALRYYSQSRGFVDAATYAPKLAMTTTVPTFAVDAASSAAVTADTEVSYTIASNSFTSGRSEAYDDFVMYGINEDKINAECIVRYAPAATNFATTDAFCLCLDIVTGINNAGEVKKKITYTTDSQEKTVFVSENLNLEQLAYTDSSGANQTHKLEAGDIFRFISDMSGEAVAIEPIYSVKNNTLLFPGHTNDTQYNKQLYPGHPTRVSVLLIGGVLENDGEYMRFAYDNPASPTLTGMSYLSTLFTGNGRALVYSKEKGTVRRLTSAMEIMDYKTAGNGCSEGVLVVRTLTPMFLFLYEE